jgi:xanthine dehydrogenase accessory factor
VNARPEQGIAADKNTFAVVKNHALDLDRGWVRQFVDSKIRYVGLLGPKARRDEILKTLTTNPLPPLFAPTGLDLDAEGPDQIAVSIVAELLALAAGREPRHLRDRQDPIHD